MLNLGTIGESLNQISGRLQADRKLFYMVTAGVFIVWILLLMEFLEVSEDLEGELAAARQDRVKFVSLMKQTEWQKLSKKAKETLVSLEKSLWPLQTEGLAKAGFQSFLYREAKKANLRDPKIRVESANPDRDVPQYIRISANLSAAFSPGTFKAFFARLGRAQQLIIVDSYSIRQQRNQRTLSAQIHVLMPNPNPVKGRRGRRRTRR